MKKNILYTLFILITTSSSYALSEYPTMPLDNLTPGALCSQPDELRYPEQIPYCKRNVSTDLKQAVFDLYMKNISNFHVDQSNRHQFKIDHYIPLCMGGSNEEINLWPQHESVYSVTDEIEFELCFALSQGSITQKQAIDKIKFAKKNLDLVKSQQDPVQFILDHQPQ